jgi:predicted nucleic-acid-binding Zn-ribbon protein
MRSGICPKCGSSDVYAGTELGYNKSGSNYSNTIPISFWYTAALDNYVCGQCGYVESYIAKESDLRRIREKWPLVLEIKAKRGE